jgi:arginyl-tRNA synthetase
VPFPNAGYRGEYIRDIAAAIDTDGISLPSADNVLAGLPEQDEADSFEPYVEALIAKAKELHGEDGFDRIRQQALDSILADIKDDLTEFGVTFDTWYSEQSLTKTGRIDAALEVLEKRGMLYKKDGATWFPATDFGDEKDRVVVRANGVKTYFASDIAYHFDKRERGFDQLIDILGADHHGYISRVRAGLEAMGYEGSDLEVGLVQFVTLYRGGERMQMSTRSGEFDTLRQLRAEVGNDAARFYYVMRSHDQHLDFDLDVATTQSNDNPVYYIQYAHARIARVFSKANDSGMEWNALNGRGSLSLLTAAQEKSLMSAMSRYPEIIELAAKNRAPQTVVHYLRDLVSDFHSCYNAHKVLVDDADLRNARLTLYAAVKIVVANGLAILGVSAPEKM